MIAQRISDLIQKTNGRGRVSRTIARTLFAQRRVLLALRDPPVRIEVNGWRLEAPLSHALPLIRRTYPLYNTNLGRLAAAVERSYPGSGMIDVGANIGDSVAFVRPQTSMPVLCIEGAESFYPILVRNLAQFPQTEPVRALVGETSGVIAGELVASAGTGHLQSSPQTSEGANRTRRLGEILDEHPRFWSAKLFKTDTDGFDTKILRGAADVLERSKPVLFFEYDPFFLARQGESGPAIFPFLSARGYRTAVVYENTGDYLLTLSLDDQRLVEDVHEFYSGRGGERYCDLAVFHADDERLGEEFRASEIAFYRQARGGPNHLPVSAR